MATKAATPANPPAKKSPAVAKRELSLNNYIAVVVIVSVLVLIVCGFIGKSLIQSIILNTKVVAAEQGASNDLDKKLQDIPVLIDNYKDLGDNKQKLIRDGLPNTADFPQLVSIVQGMATASGIDVRSITPAGETADGASAAPASTITSPKSSESTSPQPYTFSVEVTGNYNQIVTFFKNIELSARPIKVVQVDFQGSDGDVTANVQLQTYFQDKAKIDDSTEVIK